MTTLGASDDIHQEYPKVTTERPFRPTHTASGSSTGFAIATKSGTKRIRVRRCTRTLRLSNDLIVQCLLEQHNADTLTRHSHTLTVFTHDGNAMLVSIEWRELGPMTPLILTKVTKQ